jgi:multicomponent K+:H+ antiporter subunit A
VRHHDRLLTLILTGAVGLIVSLAFLQFSAPDLALTQISVEVVTTVLLLLALNLLPKISPRETGLWQRLAHGSFALAIGVAVAALAHAVLTRDFTTISHYHLAQSKPGGGGVNVVNVILVDFRGYDTFGEIIVLGIAGLAIVALLDSALRGAAGERLAAVRHGLRSPDAHPLILVVTTRILLPLALTAGAYIFLRGHNAPGGGFIAGIVIAIALIMQYMASGYAWASQRARLDPQAMIGGGIMLAGATGLAAWLFGRPFLTSAHGHVHLPLIGEVELASAVAFDLGVFMTVVGTVVVALATISRVEERAGVQPQPASPARPAAVLEEARRERAPSTSLSEERV